MSEATGNDLRESGTAAARPKRRPPGRLLLAHGEPMIWLTGGSQALCLAMIVLFLGLIVWKGSATFWPLPLERLELADGKAYLGESTREESYELTAADHASLPPAVKEHFRPELAEGESVTVHRRLYRTGNFELTNTHFHWVSDFAVVKRERPEWALTIERVKNGRFFGEPRALVEVRPWDGERDDREAILREDPDATVIVSRSQGYGQERVPLAKVSDDDEITHLVLRAAEGPAAAWDRFQEIHRESRSRAAAARRLEKEELGALSRELEAARLQVTEAALEHGKDSEAHREARRRAEAVRKHVDEASKVVLERLADLRRRNERFGLLLVTADGTTRMLVPAEIVRAYPANRLDLADKLSIYFSRWWEFLSEEPREANSEGGVMPAIFGTVVMTLLMALIVAPFGVLASLYLREYARSGIVVSAVRIAMGNLAGVPSIVFGVFGLGFFCYGFGKFIDGGPRRGLDLEPWTEGAWLTGLAIEALLIAGAVWFSLRAGANKQAGVSRRVKIQGRLALLTWTAAIVLALLLLVYTPFFEGFFRARLADGKPTYGTGGVLWASLTLALLTLPVVIVATEEALSAVPNSMREGSYACGASKWQTIRRIVLPRAMPGIMTGMILAMARGAGEVAPLMLVGAVKLAPELPVDHIFPYVHPERSFMHLGFHIYDVGFQSQNSEAAKPMVFTTALLLILIVATLNVAAIFLRSRLKRRFKGNA